MRSSNESTDKIQNDLPNEMLLHVFSFLSPQEKLLAAEVCKNWKTISEEEKLWKDECNKKNIPIDPADNLNAKQNYFNQFFYIVRRGSYLNHILIKENVYYINLSFYDKLYSDHANCKTIESAPIPPCEKQTSNELYIFKIKISNRALKQLNLPDLTSLSAEKYNEHLRFLNKKDSFDLHAHIEKQYYENNVVMKPLLIYNKPKKLKVEILSCKNISSTEELLTSKQKECSKFTLSSNLIFSKTNLNFTAIRISDIGRHFIKKSRSTSNQ